MTTSRQEKYNFFLENKNPDCFCFMGYLGPSWYLPDATITALMSAIWPTRELAPNKEIWLHVAGIESTFIVQCNHPHWEALRSYALTINSI